MTVKELIEELRKVPKSTKVISDDGTGWVSENIFIEYDKDEKQIGIYAKQTLIYFVPARNLYAQLCIQYF